jgi:hypothetical protein
MMSAYDWTRAQSADIEYRLKTPPSDFLATDSQVPGSILGAARFSEYQWVWNGVHSALVRINEELAASV